MLKKLAELVMLKVFHIGYLDNVVVTDETVSGRQVPMNEVFGF